MREGEERYGESGRERERERETKRERMRKRRTIDQVSDDYVGRQRRYAKASKNLSCGVSGVPHRNGHEGPRIKPEGARDA